MQPWELLLASLPMDTPNDFQVSGSVHHIGDTRVVSDKFSVREFTIEVPGKYPQLVTFQCSNKRLDLVESLKPGKGVTVHFNLRGREWTNKEGQTRFFNSLDCWRIELVDPGTPADAQQGDPNIPF